MIVAFVPCRQGSKSILDKNIQPIGGKPLMAWSIETGLKAELRTIVNSDSQEYLDIAKKWGAEIMLRPKELAGDKTPMFEVLESEIFKIDPVPEYVLLLQPTTPFRSVNKIKIAISYLINNPEYDSLIIAERVPDKYAPEQVIVNTPMGLRMADGRSIPQRIQARQQHKESWIPQGTYFFKTSNLQKGSIYGDKTMIMETDGFSININTSEEFKEAIQYAQKYNDKIKAALWAAKNLRTKN